MKKSYFKLTALIIIITVCVVALSSVSGLEKVNAQMPFYDLKPQNLVLRASFYTSFPSSSLERKENIMLSAKALNGTFIDVNAEFSFNKTVGERSQERGYKNSKVIVNGKFVDGVGGGVCQVSTTLYNAALIAGLKITEFHPHSLPVSYVAPSFDAMVSFGVADLRFINDTHNPIIIKTEVNDITIKVFVYGEPLKLKYVRKSVITEEILPPKEEIIIDDKGEYPDLYYGERKVLSYGKVGYRSEGYLIALSNGAPVSSVKIRSDYYGSVRGVVVEGRAFSPIEKEYFDLF